MNDNMAFDFLKILFFWTEHVQARRPRRHSSHLWVRRKIAALLLLVLLLGSSSYFWYFTTDERVRQQTTQALQQIIGGDIVIEHASLEVLHQVRITELKVYLPEREKTYENLVFSAKDVILYHKPWSILSRQLRVNEIVAYEPRLHIWYDHDQKLFNVQLLQPMQGQEIAAHTPQIILEEGSVQFSEYVGGEKVRQSVQNLRGRIVPKNEATGNIDFTLLRCKGENLDKPLLEGSYNPKTQTLKTTGRFPLRDMVEFTHLPSRIEQWEKQYQLSEIDGEVTTQTHYDPNMGHIVDLHLSGGQMKLPVPLPEADIRLEDVEADICFTNEKIRINSIHGRYRDLGNFSAHGSIAGYSTEAAFDISFSAEELRIPASQWAQLPNTDPNLPPYDSTEFVARLGPPLSSLLSLTPADIRQLLHTYSPTGAMELEVRIQRSADGNFESYGGKVTCKDIRLLYQEFPYPLEGVEGEIQIAPGVVKVGPLVSYRADHRVTVDGLWKHQDNESTFAITIDTQNSPLDERLHRALKPWQQRLWDDFQPTGRVDAHYDAFFDKSKKINESLQIQIDNVDVCFRPFPVPVTDIYGTIDSNGKQLRIEVDRARARSGDLTLKGDVTRMHQPDPQIQCQLGFHNVWLDETFGQSLPSKFKTLYEQIALQGRADGLAQLKGFSLQQYMTSPAQPKLPDRPFESMEYEISGDLKEGRIRFTQIPYPLDDVQARLNLTNEKLHIESLHGKHGKSNLIVSGQLKDPNHYYLHVEGKPIELTQELVRAMGDEPNRMWVQLNPSGLVNLTMDLKSPPEEETSKRNTRFILIEPIDCSITPQMFSYPFHFNQGDIEVFRDKFVLNHLTGSDNTPFIALDGVIGRTEAEPNCHLNISVESLALDRQFGQALPPRLNSLYEKMDPNGIVNLTVALNHPMHAMQEEPWEFEGELSLAKGRIRWPIPMENIHTSLLIEKEKKPNGRRDATSEEFLLEQDEDEYLSKENELPFETIEAGYDPKTKQLRIQGGKLSAPSFDVKHRKVQDLHGNLSYEDQRIQLTEMSGLLYEGQLAGEISLQMGEDPVEYELKLQCTDIDLKDLLTADQTNPNQWEHLRGNVTGWLNVRQAGKTADRRGTFLVIVRDAVLGELPIPAQILHVLNLSLPREGAFNEASLAGDIVGKKFRFDPIHLRGSAVALTGAGIMTQPTQQLELVFMVDSPHKLPKIPIITSFLEAFKGELAQVWVTGTFDEPKVEPVAFPTLEDALRQLSADLPPPAPKHRPTLR